MSHVSPVRRVVSTSHPPGSYFVQPEIVANNPPTLKVDDNGCSDELEANLHRCSLSNDGRGLFANPEETGQIFADSYGLALALVEGGTTACKRVLEDPCFGFAARKPGMTKPYLIAMELAAKPPGEAARKMCSDYATVLENAHDNDVAAHDFIDWFSKTTLSECLTAVRNKRRANKAIKNPPAPEGSVETQSHHYPGHSPAIPPQHLISQPEQGIRYPLPVAFIDALNAELEKVDQPSDAEILAACDLALRQVFQPRQGVGHA